MSETSTLAAVVARVTGLGLTSNVYPGEPQPRPKAPGLLLVAAIDDTGRECEPLTLTWDRVRYTIRLSCYLGPGTMRESDAHTRMLALLPTLRAAWADPTLAGVVNGSVRYAGDTHNLTTYKPLKAQPTLTARLAVVEWVAR